MKPFHHNVTAIVPHKDTPDILEACIAGLRAQEDKPYILIVDCSEQTDIAHLKRHYCQDDVSLIHRVNPRCRTTQESMACNYDIGFAQVQTCYAFTTHCDVLLKRRNLLSWLRQICTTRRPVVGYETCPRTGVTEEWHGMIGNVCSLWHMPTYWRLGLCWSYARCMALGGHDWSCINGWPDVETGINRLLRGSCIEPFFIGEETLDPIQETDDFIHIRSYTVRKHETSHPEQAALRNENLRSYVRNHLPT